MARKPSALYQHIGCADIRPWCFIRVHFLRACLGRPDCAGARTRARTHTGVRLRPAICALALLTGGPAAAGQLNAHVTVTSEYIARGLAVSGHSPALQAALDYQHDSGGFAGIWGSRIDIDSAGGGRRRNEVDIYAGYHRDLVGDWSGTVTLMRYTYPGARGQRRYDYSEGLFSAQWRGLLLLEAGYSPDAYGSGRTARHLQVGGRHALPGGWLFSGAIGRNDLSALGTDRYYYWDAGVSVTWSRVTLDWRRYDSRRFYGGGYGGGAAGARWVGSLTVTF